MKFWSTFTLLVALLVTAVLAQRRHPVDPPDTLRIGILRKPNKCSVKASKGADVTIHYRAYRWDDEQPFENTYDGKTLTFKLNDKKVIPGLDMGIEGMCVGEVRRILIPHNLGYGELGIPGLIEPNTNLMYEVELVKSMTTFTNPWFWAGLFGLALMYLIFDKLSRAEDAAKAARFVEKKQAASASESTTETSDKKND